MENWINFPLHKKEDLMECKNYRGIRLLAVAYKVFSKILYLRFLPFTNKIIGNYKNYKRDFQSGKSTINQFFLYGKF